MEPPKPTEPTESTKYTRAESARIDCEFTVLIKETDSCLDDELHDGLSWHMEFACTANFNGMPVVLWFVVWDPYLVSYADWKAIADGSDCYVRLFQGRGEGAIVQNNGLVTFISSTDGANGAGGDTSMEWSVHNSVIAVPLMAALEDAVNRGCQFK
jgi:hypothetical protein